MSDVLLVDESPPRAPDSNPSVLFWTQQLVVYLSRQFRTIKNILRGNIRIQNLRSSLLTGTISEEGTIQLTHSLGKIPEIFLVNLNEQGSVWATTSDRALWTTSTIQLSSDRPGASFTLLVL